MKFIYLAHILSFHAVSIATIFGLTEAFEPTPLSFYDGLDDGEFEPESRVGLFASKHGAVGHAPFYLKYQYPAYQSSYQPLAVPSHSLFPFGLDDDEYEVVEMSPSERWSRSAGHFDQPMEYQDFQEHAYLDDAPPSTRPQNNEDITRKRRHSPQYILPGIFDQSQQSGIESDGVRNYRDLNTIGQIIGNQLFSGKSEIQKNVGLNKIILDMLSGRNAYSGYFPVAPTPAPKSGLIEFISSVAKPLIQSIASGRQGESPLERFFINLLQAVQQEYRRTSRGHTLMETLPGLPVF